MRIEPILKEQIESASGTSKAVGVWGTLATPDGREALSPDEVRETVRRVLERAEEMAGHHADAVEVFENLNTFSLDASPELVRALADQPEVVSLRATDKGPFSFEPIETTPAETATVRRYRTSR